MTRILPHESRLDSHRELSGQEKEKFANAWIQTVLGSDRHPPNDVSNKSDQAFQAWLSKTLMEEADNLLAAWDLKPDADMIRRIKRETDPKKRTELERAFLRATHEQMQAFVQTWNKDVDSSSKWDSWPASMRASGTFNCVGASLLGANMLERAGIAYAFGGPYQHAVDIARLANQEYWYADFMNGPDQLRRIRPQKCRVAGQPVLRFHEPGIDYHLVALYKPADISLLALGNIRGLIHDAKNATIIDDDVENRMASRLYAQHHEAFELIDRLCEKVEVGKSSNYFSSPQFLREESRVKRWHAIADRAQQTVIASVDPQTFVLVRREARERTQTIRDFLLEKNGENARGLSPQMLAVLSAFRVELVPLQSSDTEEYRAFVEDLIAKLTGAET